MPTKTHTITTSRLPRGNVSKSVKGRNFPVMTTLLS